MTRSPPPRRPSRPLRWHVAKHFTAYSRQRGSEMAREGGVVLAADEAHGGRAIARVRDGPTTFLVRLAAVRREMQVTCSCPVFALGRDACRHVWAALVGVDRAGLLAPLRRRRGSPLTLALVGVGRARAPG